MGALKATMFAAAIIRITAIARIVFLTQCLLKIIYGLLVGIPFAIISKAVWTRGNLGDDPFHCAGYVEPLQRS